METIASHQYLQRPSKPMIIAGPCSAESEKQVMEVAGSLAEQSQVALMRAGVWKPRTRPNSFEGMGTKALPWLRRAQEEFGLPAIVEVATEEHVKAALDAGIRHLWVGARTTVNPFSVQEIADSLEGQDVPVFVKNPLNPDLQLWIGALERLHAAGIKKLVAIHRGFSTYDERVYRNSPKWEIPIELKTKLPELEVIVDPSHIAGKRELLREVAQKAMDLGFDGLMVEVHPRPSEALSDAQQQIALEDFPGFLAQIESRSRHFEDRATINELEQLRKLIDEIDHNLLEHLRHRLEVVNRIGEYKAQHGVTVFQLERWRSIIDDRMKFAESREIDRELVRQVWNEMHKASIRLQTDIVNQKLSLEQ